MRSYFSHKLHQKFVLAGLLSAAVAVPAWADSSSSSTAGSATSKDKAFIKEAYKGNLKEVSMAELGSTKAQSQELKQYCQKLKQDHSAANQQLQTIAQAHNVSLTEKEGKHEHDMDKFDKLNASEFDKEFTLAMLKDHQKDIEKYQKALKSLQASDVKQYAQQTLPKLQQHFQQAETVARTVGVDQDKVAEISKKVSRSSMGGGTEDTTTSEGTGSSGSEHHQH